MAFSKEQAFHLFQQAFAEHRLGHAYLISGSSHSGVDQLSEELAALVLGCSLLHVEEHVDFHRVEPESKARRILTDQMRNLEEVLHLKPQVSTHKVVIINDADRMVTAAANAFLKTLEEPPDKTLLILISLVPEAILETIRSRCIAVPLHEVSDPPKNKYEKKIELLLEQFFYPNAPTDATAAFQWTRQFQSVLAEAREEAADIAAEEFQSEKQHYGKTTDAPWEGHREEHFKATAEASSLEYRSSLLDVIVDFFGKKLRVCYENHEEDKNKNAKVISLLRCLETIESLRTNLERGVQEALALEAGFLELMEAYKLME